MVVDGFFYSIYSIGELIDGYFDPMGFFVVSSYFNMPVFLIFDFINAETFLQRVPYIFLGVTYHACLGAGIGWLLRRKSYRWALMGMFALVAILFVNLASLGLMISFTG